MAQPLLNALSRLVGSAKPSIGKPLAEVVETAPKLAARDVLALSDTQMALPQQLDAAIGRYLPSERLEAVMSEIDKAQGALASQDLTHPEVTSAVAAWRKLNDEVIGELLPRVASVAEVADNRRFVKGGFFSPEDNPADALEAAKAIFDRLNPHRFRRDLSYKAAIVNDAGIMAFGRGGDHVIMARGVLDALPEPEAAAIVAHEIGHLEHRDFTVVQIVGAVKRRALLTLDPESRNAFKGIANLAVAAMQREQEFEADRAASRMLQEAGYPPGALVSVLERLKAGTEDIVGPLSDHPTLASRIRALLAGNLP